MPHIGMHSCHTIVINHFPKLSRTFFTSSELRLEIGNVHLRISGGPGTTGQELVDFLLPKMIVLNQFEVINHHALFFDAGGVSRG